MLKIISALLLYDLNHVYLDSLNLCLEDVDLEEPVVVTRTTGKILSGEKTLLKVLNSKNLVNVYFKYEDEK